MVIKNLHPSLNILNKFLKLEFIFKNWYDYCQAIPRKMVLVCVHLSDTPMPTSFNTSYS